MSKPNIEELTRAQMGDVARQILSLSAALDEEGRKIIRSVMEIVGEKAADLANLAKARQAMIYNRASIQDLAAQVNIWAIDANNQRDRETMIRQLKRAQFHLWHARDLVHQAAADQSRLSYAIVTDLDQRYEGITAEAPADHD